MKNIYSILITLLLSVPGIANMSHPFLFSPKGIAQLHITMLNGKSINDIWVDYRISDTEYYVATKFEAYAEFSNSDSSTYLPSELYSGKILIKGRGNTSWHRPRRPYSIDLITDSGNDNPAPLLGMGSDNEWTLLTFWEDRSLMRIPLALWLGRQMSGIDFSSQTRYVELWIDGDYRGLYLLCEKVQRGDSRINVQSLSSSPADQIEPRVSGGYILEVVPWDKMKKEDEYNTKIDIPGMEGNNHWFVFKYPKPQNVTQEQRNYIFQYLTEFRNVLYGNNYTDPVNGYNKYIDVEAFIDWCIIHDLSKGVDNLFHASIFLQKDRNQKLRMTAPWDFDLSFGNVGPGSCYYEDELWIRKTYYYNRLWNDKDFRDQVKKRYDELMPLFDAVPYILQENYNQLERHGVIARDLNRYGKEILETYKNDKQQGTNVNIETYRGHVRYLKDWFESRKAWIYYNLAESQEERCERFSNIAPTIRILEPERLERNASSWTTLMRNDGKYSYKWYLNDDYLTERDNEFYQINREGTFTVRIVDSETGCESAPSRPVGWGIDDYYKSPLAMPDPDIKPPITNIADEVNKEDILIFPNPTINIMYISGVENENFTVSIYDMKGALVKQTNKNYVDVASLKEGTYLVRLTTQYSIINKIIIVSR